MFVRPRTFSAVATPDAAHSSVESSLLMLTNAAARDRAVDNDYCDSPSFRPMSAPIVESVHARTRDSGREHDHLLGRDSTGVKRSKHHNRNHPHSQRHFTPMLLPGTATHTTTSTTSLPTSFITRESRTSFQPSPTPAVPSRICPSTERHVSAPYSVHSVRSETITFTPTDPSTPPPRPPKPTGEMAVRLGLGVPRNNHGDAVVTTVTCSMQPRLPSETTFNVGVVVSQPARQEQSLAPAKSHSGNRKSLVVELKGGKSTKTQTSSSPKVKRNTPFKNNFLKKDLRADSILHSNSGDDHELIGPGGENVAKPGEHNYPCPRCGKCMCPRCTGKKRGTSAGRSHPRRFGSDKHCLCNADSCVEKATCYYCVRGCFYHCSNYENDSSCSDRPCSCRGSKCCCRWSAIGALALLFPCLLCYPIAQGCLKLCRTCAKGMRPGCRCQESYR